MGVTCAGEVQLLFWTPQTELWCQDWFLSPDTPPPHMRDLKRRRIHRVQVKLGTHWAPIDLIEVASGD